MLVYLYIDKIVDENLSLEINLGKKIIGIYLTYQIHNCTQKEKIYLKHSWYHFAISPTPFAIRLFVHNKFINQKAYDQNYLFLLYLIG